MKKEMATKAPRHKEKNWCPGVLVAKNIEE